MYCVCTKLTSIVHYIVILHNSLYFNKYIFYMFILICIEYIYIYIYIYI